MGPEAKFYNYFKKNTPEIIYTRIENTSSLGTPDVLAYNKNNTFFTIEFKVNYAYSFFLILPICQLCVVDNSITNL